MKNFYFFILLTLCTITAVGKVKATASPKNKTTYTLLNTRATINPVKVPVTIILDRNKTDVTCYGGTNGSIEIIVTGGTAPYTYAWTKDGSTINATTAALTELTAGIYTATVTDANASSNTISVTITQPTILTATTSQINATCSTGGQATIMPSGGTPPYTYSWDHNGDTTATVTELSEGTYTVTVTDANGCTVTKQFIISTTNTLSVTWQTSAACYGTATGSASVTPSGAPGPFTYEWSPSGGNSATASNLVAGDYSVTITSSNGCSIIKNFTIAQKAAVAAPVTHNQTFCESQNATVASLQATGTAIKWYSSATATTALNTTDLLVSGTYYATQTIIGCESPTRAGLKVTVHSAPTIVTQPVNETICEDEDFVSIPDVLNATEYKLYISHDGGSSFTEFITVSPRFIISGLAASTREYLFKYTVTNDCSSEIVTSDIAFLTVKPKVAITQHPVDREICENYNTTFSATVVNATSYQWQVNKGSGFTDISNIAPYSGVNTPTLTITGAKPEMNGYEYKLIVTGACGSSDISNNAILTVNTNTTIQTQPKNLAICPNANASFTAVVSNATKYQWQVNQGSGFTDISNIAPYSGADTPTLNIIVQDEMYGYQYKLIATGNCLPVESNSVSLSTSNLTLSLSPTDISCYGQSNGSITATASGGLAPYTYVWTDGSTSSTRENLPPATYTIAVMDANGCLATGTYTITQPARVTAPTATSNHTFCESQYATVASLQVIGTNIKWYSSATATTALNMTDLLATGIYYATQTINGCESATRLAVIVTITNTPAPTATTQAFCSNQNATVASLQATGTAIKWYSSATATTALNTTDLLTPGTYYATQTINGCESVIRTPVTVTLYNITAPVVTSQNFCQAATVANLPQGNGTYTWYATPTGGMPLVGTTPLTSATYYVSETSTNCESSRTPVTVTIGATDLVKQKWDDVLVFNNTDNKYLAWQWYHEGQAINGATAQYYSAAQPLNGTYFVVATASDGTTIQTCPLTIALAKNTKALVLTPNPVQSGQMLNIRTKYTDTELQGAKLIVTDSTGKNVAYITNPKSNTSILAPNTAQVYIVTLILANGKQHTEKFVVN